MQNNLTYVNLAEGADYAECLKQYNFVVKYLNMLSDRYWPGLRPKSIRHTRTE